MTPPPGEPVVIDVGDLACVRLLLELRDRMSRLPAGTLVHLTGHAYLGAVPAPIPTYALRTIPYPVTTDPASPWRPA